MINKDLEIIKPDDWHVHLRDDMLMKSVINDTAINFGRALVMPNLSPPVLSVSAALSYKNRLMQALSFNLRQLGNKHEIYQSLSNFKPYMTIFLTENTSIDEIQKAHESEEILAFKYYPAGATTNSDNGVRDLKNCYKLFELMSKFGIRLCLHGEVVDSQVDIFDRERKFIEKELIPIVERFPQLKIVFEHISTADSVQYVFESNENMAATITPQHLIYNRNDLLAGGLKPHRYCAPVLKTEKDRLALVKAATSGNNRFFLGTDSAPHLVHEKESSCGCAGCYSSPHAIPIYLEVFESQNQLEQFEKFASLNGARFYGLPLNKKKVVFCRNDWSPQSLVKISEVENVMPLAYGTTLKWRIKN